MKLKVRLRCLPIHWKCQGKQTWAELSPTDKATVFYRTGRKTWPYIVIGKPTVNPVGTIHKD